MPGVVQNINRNILKECRLQLAMPTEEVAKKIPKILDIESGEKSITFKQLETLAKLYSVPRWVFLRDVLPEQFTYNNSVPGFRKVKDSPLASDPHTSSSVKKIMAKLENLRSLILDLDNDLDCGIPLFNPPEIGRRDTESASIIIRKWLGCRQNDSFTLKEWKERLEAKGVFVFLTSKYKGWSHVDRSTFRGLSIYHDTLPIIVINDSDANKAQTFTLFHELAHLLGQESNIDSWDSDSSGEQWCDRLAGAILMPTEFMFRGISNTEELNQVAHSCKVSAYAYLVRLRQLRLIEPSLYDELEQALKREWELIQERRKNHDGGLSRDRAREIFHQYGHISNIILQAYSENEISLHKAMEILEIRKADYFSDLLDKRW